MVNRFPRQVKHSKYRLLPNASLHGQDASCWALVKSTTWVGVSTKTISSKACAQQRRQKQEHLFLTSAMSRMFYKPTHPLHWTSEQQHVALFQPQTNKQLKLTEPASLIKHKIDGSIAKARPRYLLIFNADRNSPSKPASRHICPSSDIPVSGSS